MTPSLLAHTPPRRVRPIQSKTSQAVLFYASCLSILSIWSPGGVHAAAVYQLLRSFGPTETGGNPIGPLVQGSDGFLYGSTWVGGPTNSLSGFSIPLNPQGSGALFKIRTDGSGYTTLWLFGHSSSDGQGPNALCRGTDGQLFGTTYYGGASTNEFGTGAGTIFSIAKDGSGYRILYQFGASGDQDGQNPAAGLVQTADGMLYGTTYFGGANQRPDGRSGTLFRIAPDGTGFRILHHFGNGSSDGVKPAARLLVGSDGRLYGSTYGGVTNAGTIFSIKPDGTGYSILHQFTDEFTGAYLNEPLIESRDGLLYGSTGDGYSHATIFRLAKDGTQFALLLHLIQGPACIQEGPDHKLYGLSFSGGSFTSDYYLGRGTLFQLERNGTGYNVLHSFGGEGDGENPTSPLSLGSDGALYGLTWRGGAMSLGTLFKFWLPETPAVLSRPQPNQRIQLQLEGTPGEHYQILKSADLIRWTTLTNIPALSSGVQTYLDRMQSSSNAFYRASWIPE